MTVSAPSAERGVGKPTAEAVSNTEGSRLRQLDGVLVGAAGCLLLLLSVDRIVRAVAVVNQQVEAMYGEAILYGQAASLVHGQALYQPLDQPPFTVTAYTPLYYTLVAGLRTLVGPGFAPGRILSFAAGLSAAILVGQLAARRTADRRAAIFAGLLFLGLAFPGDYPWFAFYKEDMLGVALSLGAIAMLDGCHDSGRAGGAGALAGLAFLTKQTLIAASLAGFVWLWRRNRHAALAFAGTALVVGGGPCVLLAMSNDAFLADTVRANLNWSRADILLSNLEILGRYQGIPLALTVLLALSRPASLPRWMRDPLFAFWFFSLLLLPVTLAKVGSNWNYWIESAAATAPLATSSVWALALRGRGREFGRFGASAALVALIASPLWLPRPTADLRSIVTALQEPDKHQAEEFAGVLDRVRAEPRVVLAEPLDILTLADRTVFLEPYIFSVLYQEGQWDPSFVVRQICAGQIGLLVLDHQLEGPDWQYQSVTHWPAPVLEALRATMRLDQTQARLFLYVPVTEPVDAVPCHGTASTLPRTAAR